MELHERLRKALPACTFGPPATEDEIRRVERELDVTFPEEIRRLYLHYDGFHSHPHGELSLMPLIGSKPAADSVLRWNQFRKGSGWEEGYEPPQHVLELGFLNDDEYFGVDLHTGEIVVVQRRGNEFETVGQDLYQLLVAEYQEQRQSHEALYEHIFRGRDVYAPVKPGQGVLRDIDRIVTAVVSAHPARFFLKDRAKTPSDPGGSWVLPVGFDPAWRQIRLKSATGDCPFVVESDVSGATSTSASVEQVVRVILDDLDRYTEQSRQENSG